MNPILRRLFRPRADKELQALAAEAARVVDLEAELRKRDDEGLRSEAAALRASAGSGEPLKGELRRRAFALAREVAVRALGQQPYPVQVMAALALSEGKVAEMKTGEGKTLSASMATVLFALAGKGVHVVTVNDYLAARDAEHVGKILAFLGMTVGLIRPGMDDGQRRAAYAADVTYGPNSEFGFDFLRDNLRLHSRQSVQRGLAYAIVDEADSVLVDEARTPLVISGPAPVKADAYAAVAHIVRGLDPAVHVAVDRKEMSAVLTEEGMDEIERILSSPVGGLEEEFRTQQDPWFARAVDAALKARFLFASGKDYVVLDGEVVIVDAFTGRMMAGRRFSDGLHQAIEANEGVQIQPESQTLASITYQNFYRMYGVLSGMTGTAGEEAGELTSVYGMEIARIPTHRPVIRIDEDDEVYLTEEAKIAAVADAVIEASERGQPVLVGTPSVAKSEELAAILVQRGLRRVEGAAAREPSTFTVLNARNHHLEADIVAEAGMPGAVTVATNMAGRGTDIQLGGNLEARLQRLERPPQATDNPGLDDFTWKTQIEHQRAWQTRDAAAVRKAGGLLVIGTERNESRRVDDQLRGRSGRQGDPGGSKFFVSLDDETVKTFAPKRMKKALAALGLRSADAIRHPIVTGLLEKAQKASEEKGRQARAQLLEYDDVADRQRKAFHGFRQETMASQDLTQTVHAMIGSTIDRIVEKRLPADAMPEMWDVEGLRDDVQATFSLDLPVLEWATEEGLDEEEMVLRIERAAFGKLRDAEDELGPDLMRLAEKTALMQAIDNGWRGHMSGIEELKASVGLRAVAQRNPLVEFRTDAYEMFEQMVTSGIPREVAYILMRIEPVRAQSPEGAAA